MNEQLDSITNELFIRNAVEVLDGGDAGNYTIKSDSQTVVTARI